MTGHLFTESAFFRGLHHWIFLQKDTDQEVTWGWEESREVSLSKNSSWGLEDKFKKIGHLKVWGKIILLVSKVRVVTKVSWDTSCHSSQEWCSKGGIAWKS